MEWTLVGDGNELERLANIIAEHIKEPDLVKIKTIKTKTAPPDIICQQAIAKINSLGRTNSPHIFTIIPNHQNYLTCMDYDGLILLRCLEDPFNLINIMPYMDSLMEKVNKRPNLNLAFISPPRICLPTYAHYQANAYQRIYNIHKTIDVELLKVLKNESKKFDLNSVNLTDSLFKQKVEMRISDNVNVFGLRGDIIKSRKKDHKDWKNDKMLYVPSSILMLENMIHRSDEGLKAIFTRQLKSMIAMNTHFMNFFKNDILNTLKLKIPVSNQQINNPFLHREFVEESFVASSNKGVSNTEVCHTTFHKEVRCITPTFQQNPNVENNDSAPSFSLYSFPPPSPYKQGSKPNKYTSIEYTTAFTNSPKKQKHTQKTLENFRETPCPKVIVPTEQAIHKEINRIRHHPTTYLQEMTEKILDKHVADYDTDSGIDSSHKTIPVDPNEQYLQNLSSTPNTSILEIETNLPSLDNTQNYNSKTQSTSTDNSNTSANWGLVTNCSDLKPINLSSNQPFNPGHFTTNALPTSVPSPWMQNITLGHMNNAPPAPSWKNSSNNLRSNQPSPQYYLPPIVAPEAISTEHFLSSVNEEMRTEISNQKRALEQQSNQPHSNEVYVPNSGFEDRINVQEHIKEPSTVSNPYIINIGLNPKAPEKIYPTDGSSNGTNKYYQQHFLNMEWILIGDGIELDNFAAIISDNIKEKEKVFVKIIRTKNEEIDTIFYIALNKIKTILSLNKTFAITIIPDHANFLQKAEYCQVKILRCMNDPFNMPKINKSVDKLMDTVRNRLNINVLCISPPRICLNSKALEETKIYNINNKVEKIIDIDFIKILHAESLKFDHYVVNLNDCINRRKVNKKMTENFLMTGLRTKIIGSRKQLHKEWKNKERLFLPPGSAYMLDNNFYRSNVLLGKLFERQLNNIINDNQGIINLFKTTPEKSLKKASFNARPTQNWGSVPNYPDLKPINLSSNQLSKPGLFTTNTLPTTSVPIPWMQNNALSAPSWKNSSSNLCWDQSSSPRYYFPPIVAPEAISTEHFLSNVNEEMRTEIANEKRALEQQSNQPHSNELCVPYSGFEDRIKVQEHIKEPSPVSNPYIINIGLNPKAPDKIYPLDGSSNGTNKYYQQHSSPLSTGEVSMLDPQLSEEHSRDRIDPNLPVQYELALRKVITNGNHKKSNDLNQELPTLNIPLPLQTLEPTVKLDIRKELTIDIEKHLEFKALTSSSQELSIKLGSLEDMETTTIENIKNLPNKTTKPYCSSSRSSSRHEQHSASKKNFSQNELQFSSNSVQSCSSNSSIQSSLLSMSNCSPQIEKSRNHKVKRIDTSCQKRKIAKEEENSSKSKKCEKKMEEILDSQRNEGEIFQTSMLTGVHGSEEYNITLKQIQSRFDDEYSVYQNFPKLYPNYKTYYETFSEIYDAQGRDQCPRKKESSWLTFWKFKFEDIKKEEWKNKVEKLDRLFKDKLTEQCLHSKSNMEEGSQYSFNGAINILELLCCKIGLLGITLSAMISSYHKLGANTIEAYRMFTETENITFIKMVLEKLKTLQLSETSDTLALCKKAIEWIPKLIDEAKSEVELFELSITLFQ